MSEMESVVMFALKDIEVAVVIFAWAEGRHDGAVGRNQRHGREDCSQVSVSQ